MQRRRGRPPIDPTDSSSRVCFALPSKHYDQLYRHATASRVSVPELIRQSLRQTLRNKKSSDRDPGR